MIGDWKACIHTLGDLSRVCITACIDKVLTAGCGVRNTAYYLQNAELDPQMRSYWHKMYVDCGTCKHDKLGFVLLKEGLCTCESDQNACPLAQHILQLDDLLLQMREWMVKTVVKHECPCLVNPALRQYDPNCKHCKGTGSFYSKLDEWRICRDLSTFLLCGVMATGHTVDRLPKDCVCDDRSKCTACNGSGRILHKQVRRANANDIVELLEEFGTSGVYDAQMHPRINSRFADWLREQPQDQLILLPVFRPMLSK